MLVLIRVVGQALQIGEEVIAYDMQPEQAEGNLAELAPWLLYPAEDAEPVEPVDVPAEPPVTAEANEAPASEDERPAGDQPTAEQQCPCLACEMCLFPVFVLALDGEQPAVIAGFFPLVEPSPN